MKNNVTSGMFKFIINFFPSLMHIHIYNISYLSDNLHSSDSASCAFQSRPSDKKPYNPPTKSRWSWLTSRGPTQKLSSPTLPAENHYTHMNSAYSLTDDATYAELDDSPLDNSTGAHRNNAYCEVDVSSPTYCDAGAPSSAYCDADAPSSAYCDADAPSSAYGDQTHSSAPSSAYYSDLSVSAQPDRTYEVIGVNNGYWEYQENTVPGINKLGVINEMLASDYV